MIRLKLINFEFFLLFMFVDLHFYIIYGRIVYSRCLMYGCKKKKQVRLYER